MILLLLQLQTFVQYLNLKVTGIQFYFIFKVKAKNLTFRVTFQLHIQLVAVYNVQHHVELCAFCCTLGFLSFELPQFLKLQVFTTLHLCDDRQYFIGRPYPGYTKYDILFRARIDVITLLFGSFKVAQQTFTGKKCGDSSTFRGVWGEHIARYLAFTLSLQSDPTKNEKNFRFCICSLFQSMENIFT